MAESSSSRLLSLDALRGFDMCWILGLSGAVLAVLERWLPGSGLTHVVANQFEHVAWEGFHFEDLIFPLFLFLSGVSMAIAVPKRLAREGRGAVVKHLLLRALTIFFLGVIFSGGFKDGIDGVRWLGVIQRIGIAGALAGLLSLWSGTRGLVMAAVSILLGYWLLLALVPVPGHGAGDYREGHNLTNYLDSVLLPGKKYDGNHDPEGLLSTLPAVATALLGLLAGQWMMSAASAMKKVQGLLIAGAALILLGWAWHPLFPVVKKLWSSSFVLVAAGWSAVLLAVFYWVIDVCRWQRWCEPFVWVGANPLSLYLAAGMGAFRAVNGRLVGSLSGDLKWITSVTLFALMLLTARWLYRRGILLRV
jgi:predicted acyltransferase